MRFSDLKQARMREPGQLGRVGKHSSHLMTMDELRDNEPETNSQALQVLSRFPLASAARTRTRRGGPSLAMFAV